MIGEANFSDHGANRLGASALMQGLSDGYFIIPYTMGNYLASNKLDKVDAQPSGVRAAAEKRSHATTRALLDAQGQAHRRFVPSRTGQDHVG